MTMRMSPSLNCDDACLRPDPGLRVPRAPPGGNAAGLFFCRQHVADAAQREKVAGDTEAGDDAEADRGRLRGRTAPDRVRDVDLDRRKLYLRKRRDQRRIARAEGRRVEDRG